MGDEAGMRAEVDTVNRAPLKLLRTTMNKHKPKFMKVVPPGQQKGAIAPPYAWNGRERDDWEYKTAKPKSMWEGEFSSGEFGTSLDALSKPLPKPVGSPVGSPGEGSDPGKARIAALQARKKQIADEVTRLEARRHELVQAGKIKLQRPVAAESLKRATLISLREAGDYDPEEYVRQRSDAEFERDLSRPARGPADTQGMRWLAKRERSDRREADPNAAPLGLSRTPIRSISSRRRQARKQQIRQGYDDRGLTPGRPARGAPPESAELISIQKQLEQKKRELSDLTNQIAQLRKQAQQTLQRTRQQQQTRQAQQHQPSPQQTQRPQKTHESRRLINNLRRKSLLLK